MRALLEEWRPMTSAQLQTLVAGFVLTLLGNEDPEHVRLALQETLQQWPELLKFAEARRRAVIQQVETNLAELLSQPKKPNPS